MPSLPHSHAFSLSKKNKSKKKEILNQKIDKKKKKKIQVQAHYDISMMSQTVIQCNTVLHIYYMFIVIVT